MSVEVREIFIKTQIKSAPNDANDSSQAELSTLKKGIIQNCLALLKSVKNKFKR
uniref:DUF5908 family protein n=1 Tax=Roseivirga sp. TaxID=1964215 RepID=UPI0040486B17